jgi:hypothetical protein
MGVAIFISFERDFGNETGITIDGKAIAAHLDDLDAMAQRIQLPPLSDFFGNHAELLDTLGVDIDADVDVAAKTNWFEAASAIKTVNGLLRQGKATPSLGFDAALVQDLEDLCAALKAAKAAQVRFCLSLDI